MNYPSINSMASSGAVGARSGNSGYRRGRCHQFDQKGFCSRGDNCPYEHVPSNAAIAVSDPIGYSPEHPGPINEGYDAMSLSSHATRGRGGSNVRMGRGRGRGGRGGFDSSGMTVNNANVRTILRVENMSPEQCALDQVNDYFRRFGTIVNIQVDPNNRQALVQFSSNVEAYAAYSCQDAVFGNRFIKVFWHERLQHEHWQQGNALVGSDATEVPPVAPSDADVKAQQRQAKLEQILDIQRKKEQLLQMQLEQQQLLEAQLARSDLAADARAELRQTLEKIAAAIKESQAETEHLRMQQQEVANNANLTYEQQRRDQLDRELEDMQLHAKLNENGIAPQNEDPESEEAILRAKLAKLQKEAEELGIDASSSQDYSSGGYYGRGRGRGRGAYGGWRGRGRGSMTWTPATASATAGTNAAPAPAAFKLDNRTTKIQIRDLTDDIRNSLQAHFSVNDIDNIYMCIACTN
jgi:RNA-binding protein 26